MIRVKYTDSSKQSSSVSEYPTKREAWDKIDEEIEEVKEYFRGRHFRILTLSYKTEIYTSDGEYVRWDIYDDSVSSNPECAMQFCRAIKILAAHPDRLDNFESYLSRHFDKWLERYSKRPEDMASEMMTFADMEI